MTRILRKTLLILTVAWSMILLPQQALADGTLTCQSDGTPTPNTSLFTADTAPGDTENPTSACYQDSIGVKHIFSMIICNFVSIINRVLNSVYCGLQVALIDILAAVFTVYIAVFGMQILMGTAQLNAKDIMVRFFKLAGVWVFVTNSQIGIGFAFKFFLAAAGEGVYWVTQHIQTVPIMDTAHAICYDQQAVQSVTGIMQTFLQLDYMICTAVAGPLTAANSKVLGFFLAMLLVPALWPVLGLAAYWLWTNFSVMVRAVITFLLGISAMAFLIALSPIFLSFMLFQATYQMFENWLKYMISFVLQIIVVFACISMWIMITVFFVGFFNDLSNTIFAYQKDLPPGSAVRLSADSWGVCPYDFCASKTDTGCNPGYTSSGNIMQDIADNMPYVKCKPTFNPLATDSIAVDGLLMTKTDANGDPIDFTLYIFYIIYHLIVLIIVAYVFQALMQQAPSLAVQLAGPQYVPMLGSGFGFNRYGQMMTRGGEGGKKQSKLTELVKTFREKVSGDGTNTTADYRKAMVNRITGRQ